MAYHTSSVLKSVNPMYNKVTLRAKSAPISRYKMTDKITSSAPISSYNIPYYIIQHATNVNNKSKNSRFKTITKKNTLHSRHIGTENQLKFSINRENSQEVVTKTGKKSVGREGFF
jgi:hypothetical protein